MNLSHTCIVVEAVLWVFKYIICRIGLHFSFSCMIFCSIIGFSLTLGIRTAGTVSSKLAESKFVLSCRSLRRIKMHLNIPKITKNPITWFFFTIIRRFHEIETALLNRSLPTNKNIWNICIHAVIGKNRQSQIHIDTLVSEVYIKMSVWTSISERKYWNYLLDILTIECYRNTRFNLQYDRKVFVWPEQESNLHLVVSCSRGREGM